MTTIAFGDTHAPYSDKRSLDILYQIISDVQPDHIICIGDLVDMYAISSFSRDPHRVLKLQSELDSAVEILKQVGDLTDAKKTMLPGNHCARLKKYLQFHPEIHGLDTLRLESLLKLGELGWELKPEVRQGDLVFIHGRYISKHSAYSVKRELEARAFQLSVVMGHSHRIGSFSVTGPKSMVSGWEIGCLCKQLDYAYNANWQRGFAVVTDGFVEQVVIKKGKTVFRGKKYG